MNRELQELDIPDSHKLLAEHIGYLLVCTEPATDSWDKYMVNGDTLLGPTGTTDCEIRMWEFLIQPLTEIANAGYDDATDTTVQA